MSLNEPSVDPTAVSAATEEMEHALGRVMRALIRQTEPNPPLDEMPIAQVRCLKMIGRNEGQKMQDLATMMDATLPAMSQIVERLVKRGMVERRDDPADRRVVRLHLTASARNVIDEVRGNRTARVMAAVEQLHKEGNLPHVLEGLHLLAEAAEVTRPMQPNSAQSQPRESDLRNAEERDAERATNDEVLDMLSTRLFDRRSFPAKTSES